MREHLCGHSIEDLKAYGINKPLLKWEAKIYLGENLGSRGTNPGVADLDIVEDIIYHLVGTSLLVFL
jgi:hypothetical protein